MPGLLEDPLDMPRCARRTGRPLRSMAGVKLCSKFGGHVRAAHQDVPAVELEGVSLTSP